MALVNQPPILASSFAVNGDKNTIPTTNSGTEGLASLSLGFPPITQQPVSQGGIPPQRADFNGIFNLITDFLMFIQNGSIFAYSSTLDYQPPAIVYGNNALYRCVATNGANTSAGVQPLSNASYWKPLIPVGAITISGNVITITNETGTQTQYTIDTINNPPAQSDTSNKIVTSAWVKAYAPSKSGSGAYGTWNITAAKATQDSSGQQINTTYLKKFGGQITDFNITEEGIYYWGSADTLVNAHPEMQDNPGVVCVFADEASPNRLFQIATKVNTGTIYVRPFVNGSWGNWNKVAYINSPAFSGTPTAPTPSTSDNSTKLATTAFVNNYAPSKTGSGASGTWSINISGNASTATNATQDSSGQQINTTYVKGVAGSNATLTITKGNGTTSSITINNVTNATKATQDSSGQQINTTYLKKFGGQITDFNITEEGIYYWGSSDTLQNNATEMQSKPGVVYVFTDTSSPSRIFQVANIVSNGASYIRSYVNGDWGSWNKIAYINNPAFTGTPTAPTPATSDNSTKIATTAFVKSLFTASKATNGWHKEASTGIIWQWGQETNEHDITAGSYNSLNFPINFPNACLGVIPYMLGSNAVCTCAISSYNTTSVTVKWQEWASNVQSVKFGYIAVGY